ncbi:MAG: aldo/keto reductase [Terriglobales bacterium]
MPLEAYRRLGRSGLCVSPLALGTMTFGTEWGWGSDQQAARQMVDRYVEAGGNFFDTADLYTQGTSERWLGEFLTERRQKAVIATKFGFADCAGDPNSGGNGRKNILRALEGSLRRLKTDYVDIYFLHAWDRLTQPEEVMRTLDDLVRSGKVRYLGLSNVPAWYAARAQTVSELRGREPIAALQMEYSLIERNLEHEFTDLARGYGMGIMAWSPLASGLLSGKYHPAEGGGEGSGRLTTPQVAANPAMRKFTARNWAIVAELEAVAKLLDKSMAQVALNWVAGRPGVSAAIVGATKPAQLDDNLAALSFVIPDELRRRLDAASQPERPYPYSFLGPEIRALMRGGAKITC